MATVTEKIKELHEMLEKSMITQEEFEALKKEALKKEALNNQSEASSNVNSNIYSSQTGGTSSQAYTLAITALITGIAGWFLWLPAIAAVITGHMSLKRYKLQPNQEGRGFAVAGLILGWVVLGLSIALIVLFLLAIPLFFIAI